MMMMNFIFCIGLFIALPFSYVCLSYLDQTDSFGCVHIMNISLFIYQSHFIITHAKQKQPGCKNSARLIRSNNGYKQPKTLISSKAFT